MTEAISGSDGDRERVEDQAKPAAVRAENVVHGPDQQGCLPAVRS